MKTKVIGGLSCISVLVISLSLNSCGSAQFFGSNSGSDKSEPNNPAAPGGNPAGGPDSNGPASDPNGNPGGAGGPGGSGGPGAPGAPGYKPIPGNQTPTWGPNTEVETTPNGVTFGKDHVFHIGNGKFQDSSCREEIAALRLTGSIYFFQFQVLTDNTNIDINIAKACGIDYSSGTVQLGGAGKELASIPLVAGATSVALPGKTLNKGNYTVYVYAGKGDDVKGPSWDVDDFVVGKVQIKANQTIKPGRFGTYR